MTQLILAVLTLALLSACGNAAVKSGQASNDSITTVTNQEMNKLKEMSAATDAMTAKTEELKKMVPLTLAQLKALLPETLNGTRRTVATASSVEDYSMARGDYQIDSSTTLNVILYDCAGEAGAAAYALTYWGAINAQQESENEYNRTVDFNGGKAIEEFKRDINEATLTYVSNGRLLVVLNGRNIKPSVLKNVAEDLDFKL